MIRMTGAAILLLAATAMPVQEASAQDPLGGALLGGAAGALIGGAATGRAGGAIVGGVVGATLGAAIASQGQARAGGYYWYDNRCYFRYPNGEFRPAPRRYCY